jgi:hypothetical protein
MSWFMYRDDLFIPVEIKALTIDEAVKVSLPITREVLGVDNSYCLYEGGGEVVIEYWRGKELSVKFIYANDPARALMHYYNAERSGLVRCSSVSQLLGPSMLPLMHQRLKLGVDRVM